MQLINLSKGELNIPTHPIIQKAAAASIFEGDTHYSAVNGLFELRNAIANYYHKIQQNIGPEKVLVTYGVRQAVANVLQNILSPGDEVILPCPYWFSFPSLIQQAGGKLVKLNTTAETDWAINPEELRRLINTKTKLFIFNNPHNPTGKVYSQAEVEAIVEVLAEFPNVYVLSDEIYDLIHYSNAPSLAQPSSFDAIVDRVITVNGFSKSFAMSGWRIGYIIANEQLIQVFKQYQEVNLSGLPIFIQKAALVALEEKAAFLPDLLTALSQNRDRYLARLMALPGLKLKAPQGAYYFFIDISGLYGKLTPQGKLIQNTPELMSYLLLQYKLQVFPGNGFGIEHYIRICFSLLDDSMEEAIKRFETAILALK